ncbi:MAG TPA: glycosyltransferase [Streptosporangiaceae bacterium]|nr:glycosyltransferase [Streptosporangiaceae bacterium]
MTRIVVVGVPAEGGLHNSLVTAFRRSGCAVDLLACGPWSPDWLVSAALRQPKLGARFRRDLRRRADVLAEKGPADLVLVLKGPLLDRGSIDHLRRRFDSPVVCWNPDSPFDHAVSNCGGGIPQVIGAYDAYITWAHDVAERLSTVAAQVLVIPFAWDPEIMRPTAGHGLAAGRIVFIGTGTNERSAWLQSLAHLRPMVFGSRWPNIAGVDIRPPVKGIEFCRVAGEAKWNINLLRPQNARSHNMRTFELVGTGGRQVAPQTNDHRRFLGGDSRTVLFQNKEELESILRSDPCARPPRLPALLEGHTYADRADQLLAELGIS